MSETQHSEEWRDVEGYPGYQVSDLGRVRSCRLLFGTVAIGEDKWRLIVGGSLPKGHTFVRLRRAGEKKASIRYVHRLVLEAFVGPCPEGMETCHFPDRDPRNNRLSNLRWDTPKANQADKLAHGTHNRGERCGTHKLKEADVLRIRELYGQGLTQIAIAKMFPVCRSQISAIIQRKRWAHLS